MLDNQTPSALEAAAARLKADFPHVLIEGSGGITEQNIGDFMVPRRCPATSWHSARFRFFGVGVVKTASFRAARADVDVLSTSWIHQGVPHIDFSLKIQPKATAP
jgi:nicotinate-nucleotide pyrophosphorylase (carboxylating)